MRSTVIWTNRPGAVAWQIVIRRGLIVVVVVDDVDEVDVATAVAIVVEVVVVPPPPPLFATVVVVEEVVVVGAEVMVNEIEAEVAEAYGPLEVIVAVIVHVPASINVTTPVDELIVQAEVVELEYDFVPEPTDGVDVIVGGVALPE